jgi:hypothetical protein
MVSQREQRWLRLPRCDEGGGGLLLILLWAATTQFFRRVIHLPLWRAQWVVVRGKQRPQPARFATGATPLFRYSLDLRWHFSDADALSWRLSTPGRIVLDGVQRCRTS